MSHDRLKHILIFTFPHLGHVNPTIPLVKEFCKNKENKVYLVVSKKYAPHFQTLPCECIYYQDDIERFAVQNSDQDVTAMLDNSEQIMQCFQEYYNVYNKLTARNPILQGEIQWDVVLSDTYAAWGKIYAIVKEYKYIGVECFLYEGEGVKKKIIEDFLSELSGYSTQQVQGKIYNIDRSLEYVQKKLQRKHGFTKQMMERYFGSAKTIVMIGQNLQPYMEECKEQVSFWGNDFECAIQEKEKKHLERKKILITLGREKGQKHIVRMQTLLEEFKKLKQYDVIVTTLCYEQLKQYNQEHIHIYEKIEQQKVLKEAELFITHGGITGVKEALKYRVPMIFMPSSIQQLAVSKNAQKRGLGIVVTEKSLSEKQWEQILKDIFSGAFQENFEKALEDVCEKSDFDFDEFFNDLEEQNEE